MTGQQIGFREKCLRAKVVIPPALTQEGNAGRVIATGLRDLLLLLAGTEPAKQIPHTGLRPGSG